MWFCVSLLIVSPHKPCSAAKKMWNILPSTNRKLGVFLITLNILHWLFLPQNTQCVLNIVLLADKLHISLTHFKTLQKALVGKCSNDSLNIIFLFFCCVRTVGMNFIFQHIFWQYTRPVIFLCPMKCYFTNNWLARCINIMKFLVPFTVAFTVGWILIHHSIQNICCRLPLYAQHQFTMRKIICSMTSYMHVTRQEHSIHDKTELVLLWSLWQSQLHHHNWNTYSGES